MGVDYAFDTTFSADLTIMEEGTEFLHRFTAGELKERPMFTSCCPGWLRFIKSQYPTSGETAFNGEIAAADVRSCDEDLLCREARSISAEDLHSISNAMCGKKREKEMELFYQEYAGHDVDTVITTRELTKMIKSAHISPDTLSDIESDRPMQDGTGAGVIFGATGGVMEAALRTAYYCLRVRIRRKMHLKR